MHKSKKILITFLLAFFLVGPVIALTPQPAAALSPDVVVVNSAKWVWEQIKGVYQKFNKQLAYTLVNNTVRTYVNQLAYNIANSIEYGGPGQNALKRTTSVKDSLKKSQEAAIGEFIGTLQTTAFSDLGFNLCDPSVEVKLTLTLGLIDSEAPPAPKCNWREVQKNWSQFSSQIKSGEWQNFLKLKLDPRYGSVEDWQDFWSAFDQSNSDLGAAMTLVNAVEEQKARQKEIDLITSTECQGYVDVKATISEDVKTHCAEILNIDKTKWDAVVKGDIDQKSAKALDDSLKIGDILKDAGNLFLNTLSSKMLKIALQWGQDRLKLLYADKSSFRNSLLDALRGGADLRRPARGADVFRDLLTVDFGEVESYSVLENFAVCPDQADFRHPDNCVITAELLNTISQKKTISNLLADGLLNPSTVFIGANDARNNSDTCYREGFCYHNLVKLRKANIIPIGWEIAAELSPAGEAVTLGELVNCFEDEGCPYATGDSGHNPYYHLVDPDWVLKLPPARCEALVFGSTIESSQSNTRQEYCADIQTCLREDDQGNCLDGQYGYCTLSENIWRLDGDLCEDGDIYSGCLSFQGDNGSASYLEQSLDYCTADEAGCLRYSQEQDLAGGWVLTDIASDGNDLFLNDKAGNCPSDQAGCHEYIVMAGARAINLFSNGNFDYYQGDVADNVNDTVNPWDFAGAGTHQIVDDAYYGATALLFNQNISTNLNTGYALRDRRFIVSFYAKAPSAGTPINIRLASGNSASEESYNLVPEWRLYQLPHTFAEDISSASLNVTLTSINNVSIDGLKIEEVGANQSAASNFSAYGDGGRIFMDDGRQMCVAEEVGCQGYFPANDDPMIPGIISAGDLCPSECVGYATFAENPNNFDLIENNTNTEYYNFIPNTALSCPVAAAGCEEFTNLDELNAGGEGKEYYTYLRQCVPSSASNVETYFTWEGEDVSGYQLKTWTFLKSNFDNAPCTNVEPGTNTCVDDGLNVFACGLETPDPLDDPEVDANCREFFDTAGSSHYRLQDKVIFASNDCQPYRRSATGQQYQAIPDLSYSCQAQYAGCSLYEGETANNLYRVFLDNFEAGTYSPWSGSGLDLSNQSLANNGHSLRAVTNSNISRSLSSIQNNKIFQVSLWMKNTGNLNSIQASLSDGENDYQIANIEVVGFGDWRLYQLSSAENIVLNNLDSPVLTLRFNGSGEVFLDNITLKQVENALSFIKNSWQTPNSCDTPFLGAYLGCQAYQDANQTSYNLKSFSSLCREDAIGCLAVIDTHNSDSPFAETFNSGDYSQISVAADNVTYLVPDVNNYCPEAYNGCSALGLPIVDQATNTIEDYSTVYKINDPDNYSNSLCSSEALYCQAFDSDKGTYYFKDPGTKNCTYQKNVEVAGQLTTGWFKTESLDSGAPVSCSEDNNFQLQTTWAASCPAEKNLCTEFRDPLDPQGCEADIAQSYCEDAAYFGQESCEENNSTWHQSCQTYYYYNNDQIDQSSCNGQFDRNGGCILLYDANNWNGEHSEVLAQYSAANTYASNLAADRPVSPELGNDSNVLVKVRQDRQCAEWLACKSSTAVFDEKTSSYKIICDAIDSCTEYSDSNNITQCAQWSSYTDEQILTTDVYQSRATGVGDRLTWSDKEYLGYSIPNFFPVKDLEVYNFSTTTESDLRLVYNSGVACELAAAGQVCQVNGASGTCQDQICWLNPNGTEQIIHLDTRAYAQQDGPFSNVVKPKKNSSDTSLQRFSNVNVCENGDDACELGYKKVTYGLGGFVRYYGQSANVPAGLCTIIGDNPPDDPETNQAKVEGAICDPGASNSCGVAGRCTAPSKVETFLNWPGICLESDPSTVVPIDGAPGVNVKNYCNQWYPVDQIQGAQSLYNNFTTAGFYSDTGNDLEMCAVAEPYVTTEDQYYCVAANNNDGSGVPDNTYCTVLAKVPAGTKVNTNKAVDFNNLASLKSTSFQYVNAAFVDGGLSASIMLRNNTDGTDDICDSVEENNGTYYECFNLNDMFKASDFNWSGGGNVLNLEGIVSQEIFSQIFTDSVTYLYFDESVRGGRWRCTYIQEDINGDGIPDTWHQECDYLNTDFGDWFNNNDGGSDNGGNERDNDKFLVPGFSRYYSRDGASNTGLCQSGFHQVEITKVNEDNSDEDHTHRYCNPNYLGQDKNYYVLANTSLVEWNRDPEQTNDYPYNAFMTNSDGPDCTGLNCFQQCQIISQVDAEGAPDKSWVRTDIWYRSEQDPSLNNGWQARFYDLNTSAYTALSSNIFFANAGDQAINNYFGAAQGSSTSTQVVTQAPLNNDNNPNEASIFFSSIDFNAAKVRMKYLFAQVYNLTWDNNQYIGSGSVNIDDGTKVNLVAGDDYNPVVYQVCGQELCPANAEGITINNQNNQNIVGRGSLFTAIKFYYHAHPDHMPVSSIQLDQDNGLGFIGSVGKYKNNLPQGYCDPEQEAPNGEGQMSFGGLARACQVGYKTFYADYTFDPDNLCVDKAGAPDIANASCYQPKVKVIDNWDLGDPVSYGAWIVVYQE